MNKEKVKLTEIFRHYWHEVYYFFAGDSGVKFAMTCKDVAEQIDLGLIPDTWIGRLRLRLHMSLCQACRNYLKGTKALKKIISETLRKSGNSFQMERLNKELINKYSKKSENQK